MDAPTRSRLMETAALPGDVAPSLPDDDDVLTGLRTIAEFSTSEGFPVSHSTIQKYCSPAIGTGPTITGFWGALPTTTKGLVRAWIKSRHRSTRPVNRREPWQQRGRHP
jgi:hypothetical protein